MKKFFIKVKNWFKNHKPSKRRLIQLYAAVLYNANTKGYISGSIYQGNTKYMCVPGMNCYSCPGAIGSCPLGAFQNALISSDKTAPYYILGILALFGLMLGRTICGFLCPIGLVQDLTYKIKTPKVKKSKVTRVLSYLKYVLLVVFAIAVPLALSSPGFCKYICPAGVLGGALGLLSNPNNTSLFGSLGGLFTWKFLLTVSVVVGSVFIYRIFCRFMCPLGAIYGFFNKIALLGVKLDKEKCTDCGLCLSECKMDIKHVGDHECINCGECIKVCQTKAISWKGSKIFLKGMETQPAAEEQKPISLLSANDAEVAATEINDANVGALNENLEKTEAIKAEYGNQAQTVAVSDNMNNGKRRVKYKDLSRNEQIKKRNFWLQVGAWIAAIAVLGVAIWFYNFHEEESERFPLYAGMQVPDFEIGVYDRDENGVFTETGEVTVSAESLMGKVTIINYWGTWCPNCIDEIPYFYRYYEENADKLNLVFVHSVALAETALEYLNTNYIDFNSNIIFAQDEIDTYYVSGMQYEVESYKRLGGTDKYPMTVILDENGIVKYAAENSMNYEFLSNLVNPLLS